MDERVHQLEMKKIGLVTSEGAEEEYRRDPHINDRSRASLEPSILKHLFWISCIVDIDLL